MRDDGGNRALILVLLLVLWGLGVRVWYAAEALRVDRFVDEKYSLLNIRAIVTEGTLKPASSYYPYPLFNARPGKDGGDSAEADRGSSPSRAASMEKIGRLRVRYWA